MTGERILIVDPNAEQLKIIAEQILSSRDFKLLLAQGQEEGVKLALAESPHLLLLHLPLDSSARLLHCLAQAERLIPSILMVEEQSAPIAVEFLRLGVRDYVVHPFAAKDILRAVHQALDQEPRSPDYRQLAEDLTGFNRELEQRVKEYNVLLGIGRSVSSSLDLDSVLNRATEAAVFITGAEEGYLLLLDEEAGELRLRAAQNLGEKQAQGFSIRVEDSTAGAVISSGKPILLSGKGDQNFKVKTGYLVKSLLNVPLKANGRVIGVLGVDNQISNANFTLAHLRRLSALADMAATAVENARQHTEMHKKLTRRVKEIATLQAVADQLSAVTDFDVGARLALSLALKATNAEAGVLAWAAGEYRHSPLYVSQGSLGELVLTHKHRGGVAADNWWDDRILQKVIETGQPILSEDLGRQANGNGSCTRSRLVVPMRRGKEVIGAINLESSSPHAFAQDDLHFVVGVADQVAIALEGTVLQEKVESERQRLSLLMEAVDNAVWVVDADLRLMAQNEVASKILSRSPAKAIGRFVYELMPPSDASPPVLCQLLSRAMEEQQPVSFDEGILLAATDNQPIVAKGKVVPIIQGNRAVGAFCAFREITPEKNSERVRLEFANMASHLLRAPLSSIQASIDLLSGSELSDEEHRATLDTIQEQSVRIREFINGLLEVSRIETGSVRVYSEPVTLPPLIERVLNLSRHEETHHVFNFIAADGLPIVAADPGKTELILLHLLRSAVERCPDGGHITIELEERMPEVVISVVDDGEAMSAHQLDKIFWQFYPVDDDNGKMPSTYHLGLYTTKRLVELQNGRVWAQSQPDQGSRFSFSLPVWGVSR